MRRLRISVAGLGTGGFSLKRSTNFLPPAERVSAIYVLRRIYFCKGPSPINAPILALSLA